MKSIYECGFVYIGVPGEQWRRKLTTREGEKAPFELADEAAGILKEIVRIRVKLTDFWYARMHSTLIGMIFKNTQNRDIRVVLSAMAVKNE